jgi:hypothetical protein
MISTCWSRAVVMAGLASVVCAARSGVPSAPAIGAERDQQATPAVNNPRDPVGTGTISGQVVDDDTGQPLAGVRVTRWISTAGTFQHEVISDDDGRFLFRDVGLGRYRVVAEFPGYGAGAFGRRRPNGPDRTVLVGAGANVSGISLRLFSTNRTAVSGTITDDAGEPAAGITVVLLQRLAGSASAPDMFAYPTVTQTDDRGRYSFGLGLAAGERGQYVIVVPPATTLAVSASDAAHPYVPPVERSPGFSSAVHVPTRPPLVAGDLRLFVGDPSRPGLIPEIAPLGPSRVYPMASYPPLDAGADGLDLDAGTERRGVDLQLTLMPAVRITGQLVGPSGPVAHVGVRLVPTLVDRFSQGSDAGFDVAQSITDEGGRFTLVGVPPGHYLVRVRLAPEAPATQDSRSIIDVAVGHTVAMAGSQYVHAPDAPLGPTLLADVPVTVAGADLEGLDVVLRRGASVSGRVAFDAVGAPPTPEALAKISVWLQPVDATPVGLPLYKVAPTGQFVTAEYPPGTYTINTLPPTGWVVKSATYRETDVFAEPLELGTDRLDNVLLTFTDKVASLSGVVTTTRGTPDPDATVLVFPVTARMPRGSGAAAAHFKQVRVMEDGTYAMTGLLAGDYGVVAIDDRLAATWREEASLAALARLATRVTLREREAHAQDLHTQVVK